MKSVGRGGSFVDFMIEVMMSVTFRGHHGAGLCVMLSVMLTAVPESLLLFVLLRVKLGLCLLSGIEIVVVGFVSFKFDGVELWSKWYISGIVVCQVMHLFVVVECCLYLSKRFERVEMSVCFSTGGARMVLI